MTKVAVMLASGFEEIEALTVVDVLRRAAIECQMVGFDQEVTGSHGITVKVDGNTRMNISGRDKELVGQFAASVRRWRPPEPYKGKGIKFQGEVIRRKAGKAGKKK